MYDLTETVICECPTCPDTHTLESSVKYPVSYCMFCDTGLCSERTVKVCAFDSHEFPYGLYRINCLLVTTIDQVAEQAERRPHIIYFVADEYFSH